MRCSVTEIRLESDNLGGPATPPPAAIGFAEPAPPSGLAPNRRNTKLSRLNEASNPAPFACQRTSSGACPRFSTKPVGRTRCWPVAAREGGCEAPLAGWANTTGAVATVVSAKNVETKKPRTGTPPRRKADLQPGPNGISALDTTWQSVYTDARDHVLGHCNLCHCDLAPPRSCFADCVRLPGQQTQRNRAWLHGTLAPRLTAWVLPPLVRELSSQGLGDWWIDSKESAVLEVPSAVVADGAVSVRSPPFSIRYWARSPPTTLPNPTPAVITRDSPTSSLSARRMLRRNTTTSLHHRISAGRHIPSALSKRWRQEDERSSGRLPGTPSGFHRPVTSNHHNRISNLRLIQIARALY